MAQELKAYNVVATADVNPEVVDSLGCTEWAAYNADEVNAVLSEKDAEIRRLKRALYKACFNWAHFAVAFFAEYKTKEKWRKMENKCLAKAELYR